MVRNILERVFTDRELARVTIDEGRDYLNVTVDVHGMKCREARRIINNIINLLRMKFQLIIIHGYNHGTAIKDMLATNFNNSHVTKNYLDFYNQGVTHLLIALKVNS